MIDVKLTVTSKELGRELRKNGINRNIIIENEDGSTSCIGIFSLDSAKVVQDLKVVHGFYKLSIKLFANEESPLKYISETAYIIDALNLESLIYSTFTVINVLNVDNKDKREIRIHVARE